MPTETPSKPTTNRAKLRVTAHATLGILFLMNLLNYIDRSVLNAVLPLVKSEWEVSDTTLGILNSAFVITYMVFSPVFGWLGDRAARKWIAAAGLVVWSLTTAVSALAKNFLHLFGLRMIFGVGEAGFSTVAPTIIADLYPSAFRSRVLSVFYVAIPVGYALGFIIGGAIGEKYGWRAVFPVVGLPGLLILLPMLLMREPKRGESEAVSAEALEQYLKRRPSASSYLGLISNGSYVCNTIAMILMTFVTGAFAWWGPTYFHRVRSLELAYANYCFGIATLLAGITGTFFGGWLADALQKKIKSAYFLVSGVGMLLGVPALLVVMLADTPQIYWVAVFFAEFFLFLNTGPANAIILNVTAPNMRAGAFAVNIFLIHALGDVISPVIVGGLSDVTNLHLALISTMPLITVFGGAFYLLGMRYLEKDTHRVLEQIESVK
ncbi:MAG: MFS transporter [Candidatus Lindowbacteria bacterium]|nr:MFS transporter [Candidatus Lindowbacteria bacterium]